ncbi:MAG: flagellar hook-associated protein FlgK [Firmicutes bacterium]|jgi:flagellar hook-associated protein 1 FlgK|nr:flagellar hook-associated protein FlgK [Bacillota bacterium]
MYSTFLALETARRALSAHQKAMEVVGHNIANAGNPGYVRREAVLEATPPYVIAQGTASARGGAIGTGVEVIKINRIFDGFLEGRIRESNVTLGYWEGLNQVLTEIEGVFQEPSDVGLGEDLTRFFLAWDSLSSRPEGTPLRAALIEESKTLASHVNRITRNLRGLSSNIDADILAKVSEINSLTQEIAAKNYEIVKVTAVGNDPGDLRDKRDLAISRLSRLINITAFETEGGAVAIQIGSRDLVREDFAYELTYESGSLPGEPLDPDDIEISRILWKRDLAPVDMKGGDLAARLEGRNERVPEYYDYIETFITTICDEVNNLHRSGFGIDDPPTGGRDFYIYDSDKRILRVNPALDPEVGGDLSLIAAASTQHTGDGQVAFAIAGLKDELVMEGGTESIPRFYQNLVARIGVAGRNSGYMTEVHEATYRQCINNKDSVSGVSIDEELINLTRYQRVYQAASRFFTVVDEMLDTIINRTGIVGR